MKLSKESLALLAITVVGCMIAMEYCMQMQMDFETTQPGVMALFATTDPLLANVQNQLPDPYTIEYMLQYVPMWLSNYSFTVLRLDSYAGFLAILLAWGYFFYKATGDEAKALAFTALLATMNAGVVTMFVYPSYHNWTLAAAGVLYAWLLEIEKKPYWLLGAAFALFTVAVYNDAMLLIFFAAPFLAYHAYKLNNGRGMLMGAGMVWMTFVTLAFKMGYTNTFAKLSPIVGTPTGADRLFPAFWAAVSYIDTPIGMFFNGVDISAALCAINPSAPIPAASLIALPILALLVLAVWWSSPAKKDGEQYAWLCFVIWALGMAACYVVMPQYNIARYMVYVTIPVLGLLAVCSTPRSRKLLIIIAFAGLLFNAWYATTLSEPKLDQDLYEATVYLYFHDYTYGYSDYHAANVVKYITRGQIIAMNSIVQNNTVYANEFFEETSWYRRSANHTFIIASPPRPLPPGENDYWNGSLEYAANHTPTEVKDYGGYRLYLFDNITLDGGL